MDVLHCLATEDGATCSICDSGYHNEDMLGVCVAGDVYGCLVYANETCVECQDEMRLDDGLCYNNIPYCRTQVRDECFACLGVYILYNHVCYVPVPHCSTQAGSTCQTCEPGYVKSGSICVPQ